MMNYIQKKIIGILVVATLVIISFFGSMVSAERIDFTREIPEKCFEYIENNENPYDVVVTDISFSIMKIVATVENRGVVDANVDITFSVSKGIILPWVIGHPHVTVPAGETIQVTQRFTGLGRYSFSVHINECGNPLFTGGFWFLFFGWEMNYTYNI